MARPGETVALVGPSGAGKSSIISLIEHFYESNTGQVMLDDILINQYDHVYYHQKVGCLCDFWFYFKGEFFERFGTFNFSLKCFGTIIA